MSANNKISKISGWFMLLLIIILTLTAFSLISCQKQETPKYSIIVLDEEDSKENTGLPDERPVINIPETNQTPIELIIPNQPEDIEKIENDSEKETDKIAEGQEQQQAPERANAVDFYFLLKGKSYFRYTLYEGQAQAFNMSNTIIRIVPLFIVNDSVIFRVDDYTTGAVRYKDWFSTPGFEIYVTDIYYRG
jgi:hypothetical protein